MATADTSTEKRKPAAMPEAGDVLTPAMRQYVEQKKRVGEAVLLFRMGDFYETFWDDAVLCAKVLGIALTSRSKKTTTRSRSPASPTTPSTATCENWSTPGTRWRSPNNSKTPSRPKASSAATWCGS